MRYFFGKFQQPQKRKNGLAPPPRYGGSAEGGFYWLDKYSSIACFNLVNVSLIVAPVTTVAADS